MSEFSGHTKWQADHYNSSPPLSPFEPLLRKIGYAKVLRPKDLVTKQYLEKCNIDSSTKILDVGCASGVLLQRIQVTFHGQGTGIDVSEVLIRKAQQENPENTYLLADATTLPFPDNSFDVVTSCDNLEHIQEYRQVIKEMVRILKPGGKLILNSINKNNKYTIDWLLEKIGTDYHLKRAGHVKELFFNPVEIEQLFNKEGLTNTNTHLFDATTLIIFNSALYIFLMASEFIARNTNYPLVGHAALSITDFLSKISLPFLEKVDTLVTQRGYSNAFFLTGEKK